MDGTLSNKTAIVTGGGSGIGRAIAQRLAKEGANVVICGRTESSLKETAEVDAKICYVVGDMTKTETIEKMMTMVKNKFGRLDILVNNAGWCPVQPITEITIDDYDKAFSLDVRALVEMTIHALPMIRESHGSIINLSSSSAQVRFAQTSGTPPIFHRKTRRSMKMASPRAFRLAALERRRILPTWRRSF